VVDEGAHNIAMKDSFKSKTAVEEVANTREHRLAITKCLKERLAEGDLAVAKQVCDLQERYIKRGVFNNSKNHNELFEA